MIMTLEDDPIVLETVVKEGPNSTLRQVRLMRYTPENLSRLWDKVKGYRMLFSDEINGDFDAFCATFFTGDSPETLQARGITWIVDDFLGVYYLNKITTTEAKVDFSFFDARLRPELTKLMIKYVFETYGFERLNIEIARFANTHVFDMVKELGFQYEGCKRKAIKWKDKKHDLILYGLLREEMV